MCRGCARPSCGTDVCRLDGQDMTGRVMKGGQTGKTEEDWSTWDGK